MIGSIKPVENVSANENAIKKARGQNFRISWCKKIANGTLLKLYKISGRIVALVLIETIADKDELKKVIKKISHSFSDIKRKNSSFDDYFEKIDEDGEKIYLTMHLNYNPASEEVMIKIKELAKSSNVKMFKFKELLENKDIDCELIPYQDSYKAIFRFVREELKTYELAQRLHGLIYQQYSRNRDAMSCFFHIPYRQLNFCELPFVIVKKNCGLMNPEQVLEKLGSFWGRDLSKPQFTIKPTITNLVNLIKDVTFNGNIATLHFINISNDLKSAYQAINAILINLFNRSKKFRECFDSPVQSDEECILEVKLSECLNKQTFIKRLSALSQTPKFESYIAQENALLLEIDNYFSSHSIVPGKEDVIKRMDICIDSLNKIIRRLKDKSYLDEYSWVTITHEGKKYLQSLKNASSLLPIIENDSHIQNHDSIHSLSSNPLIFSNQNLTLIPVSTPTTSTNSSEQDRMKRKMGLHRLLSHDPQ